jgi:peroxin-13
MFRRCLVLGVGLAALLWTLATPSQLQAQHGRGGFRSGTASHSSGFGNRFNTTGFSRTTAFSRGFGGFGTFARVGGFGSFGGFGSVGGFRGFGGFGPGINRSFYGSGFGSGFYQGSFFPGYSGFVPRFTPPYYPPTDAFGRPLFLPSSSGY